MAVAVSGMGLGCICKILVATPDLLPSMLQEKGKI